MYRIALVDESGILPPAALASAAIALQIRLDRDMTAHWGAWATLVVARVPTTFTGACGRCGASTRGGCRMGARGIHLDEFGHPYALVSAGQDWTVAVSHELLEMVVDPRGNCVIGGSSASPGAAGRAVYYLVEVRDPCETSGDSINETRVSGFVLPAFCDRATVGPLDLLGRMTGPLQILLGGYLSWYYPGESAWHEALPDGTFSSTVAAARLDATNLRGLRDLPVAGSRHDLRTLLGSTPAGQVEGGGRVGIDAEAEPSSTFEQERWHGVTPRRCTAARPGGREVLWLTAQRRPHGYAAIEASTLTHGSGTPPCPPAWSSRRNQKGFEMANPNPTTIATVLRATAAGRVSPKVNERMV